jgi:DNA-binding transcriptional LysR family regulator
VSNTNSVSRAHASALSTEATQGSIGDVSLAQIRYFVAVAEEGNVGRAAQRLRVAQPPVSRQIRALEDELGAKLFERTPRGMTLLPPGQVFLEHARGILDALDRAVDAARAESPLDRGGRRRPRDG